MTAAVMPRLPLGNSDFSALREAQQIYVDKTAMIADLCQNPASKVFLSRPRRFGKSLLVSTFESLFAHGLRDFRGLALERRWTDRTYPVVRLDFSAAKEFASIEAFAQAFQRELVRKFQRAGFSFDPHSFDSAVGQIGSWMTGLPGLSLVLLIDEYDAPLTACLHQPALFRGVQSQLSQFFLMLKEQSRCLRFLFMTGITKFSNTGIFSAFNNLDDISLTTRYGALLGYTQSEIAAYFQAHLKQAAASLAMSESDVLEALRDNYDGFCFDEEASTHVYCPWSVLNFLNAPKRRFQNYWYLTGGQPTALMNYLKSHELADPTVFNQPQELSLGELNASQQYETMTTTALLTQAGYLTIKKVLMPGYVELGYPNREVTVSLAQVYADELLRGASRIQLGLPRLHACLADGDLDGLVDIFNRTFNVIDFKDHPIKNEAACRAYLQVLFIGAAMCPLVERHYAKGRSDLEVRAGPCRWVFELKFSPDGRGVDKLLRAGAEQMLSKDYGLAPDEGKLLRVVLVFDGSRRKFAEWTILPEPELQAEDQASFPA